MPHYETKLTWLILAFVSLLFFLSDGHDLMRTVHHLGTIEQAAEMVDDGNILRRISLLVLFALATISLMRKDRRPFNNQGVLGWVILFYLVWAIFSITWAADHRLTFRRICVLGIFCISALAVAERFSLRTIILWVFASTLSYLIIGFLAEIVLGAFHPLSADYRFSGTLHPNHQGINCVLLMFSSLSVKKYSKRIRPAVIAIAWTAMLFLILTKSRTSFGCAIIVLVIYWLSTASLSRRFLFFFGSGFIVCLMLLMAGNDFLTAFQQGALMGRSSESDSVSTLTGRTPLWEECLTYLRHKPIQGYGYGGFWTSEHIGEISGSQGWNISSSHSIYIEEALQLGIVGIICYVIILFGFLIRSIIYLQMEVDAGYLYIVLLVSFCILHGILESVVVQHRFLMFLFIIGVTRICFLDLPAAEWYGKQNNRIQKQTN